MPPADVNADAGAAGFKVGEVYPAAAAAAVPLGTVAPVKVGDVAAAVACPCAALTVCWMSADASASVMGVPTRKFTAALWPADASDSAAAAAPVVGTDGAKNMPLVDIVLGCIMYDCKLGGRARVHYRSSRSFVTLCVLCAGVFGGTTAS